MSRRRFDIFELTIAGGHYQVIARLRYHEPVGADVDAVFGFLVDLDWVRRHYFQTLPTQVASIRRCTTEGLALAVLDERGKTVAATDESGQARVGAGHSP